MMAAAALARTLVERAGPGRVTCRHCGRRALSRGRSLCSSCHRLPSIRRRYGPASPCGRRTRQFSCGKRPLPAFPTAAVPGTEAKVRVLRARAAWGELLFHPGDVRLSQVATRPTVPPVTVGKRRRHQPRAEGRGLAVLRSFRR